MRVIVRQMVFFSMFLWSPIGYGETLVDFQAGEALYQKQCARCHGPKGQAVNGWFPNLAAQNPTYAYNALQDYQTNKRYDPIMTPISQKLSSSEINNLLSYMASFPAVHEAADPLEVGRGEKLYRAGDIALGIPACAACHGPAGRGNNAAGYPALAGQNALYVQQQLENFKTEKRKNIMMQDIAKTLTPEDQKAVASFISGFGA